MKEFDLNHDGKVSWDEFKSSLSRIKGNNFQADLNRKD
jgi:Ca2+-binding EF-hand superfamily protein